MMASDFQIDQLPTPQEWIRKHDFGGRDYETLAVFYVPERVYEGIPRPRMLRCAMFGTLMPQEEPNAPDVETGQMMLDALFAKHFPEHRCNERCTGWSKSGKDDPDPSAELGKRPIQ